MSARQALQFAWGRFMAVLWAGIVAFVFYTALVTFGPGIEGKFFPVIRDYKLTNIEAVAGGGFSFTPEFEKVRDCTYHGITWFAPDDRGNNSRIQGRREEEGNSPPQTGPMGQRTGIRQTLIPPPEAQSIVGYMHHDCGFIWQTRTQIGPFKIRGGVIASQR